MTDKKFTDEEIIETLERCSKGEGCFGCVKAYMHSANCIRILEAECLDLINRQKAEIDNLNKQMEWLTGYNGNLMSANTALSEEILLEKTKAYKEFAERLKKHYKDFCVDAGDMAFAVDNLFKEIVGEEE